MDITPRRLSALLPGLAFALGVECVVALTPAFTGTAIRGDTCIQALVHVPQIALILGLAIGVLVMTWHDATRIACQRLLYGGHAAILATAAARYIDFNVDVQSPRAWLFMLAGGSLLTATAAPGLWGCAFAREQDLRSERITRASRAYAAVAFFGLLCLMVSEEVAFAGLGFRKMMQRVDLRVIVFVMIQFAGRVLLLISGLLSWFPPADELQARRRSLWIAVLMGASVVSAFLTEAQLFRVWDDVTHGFGSWINNVPMVIWHAAVQLTLTLLTMILVSMALETPDRVHVAKRGGFVPEPPPRPRDTGPIDLP